MDVTELPFNRLIGIAASGQDGRVLTLPADVRYTNHLGTVHASALLALAEATSGDYLIKEFGQIGLAVVPVVRRLEAKFRKPATGAVSSTVKVAPEKRDAFLAALTSKGRALLAIEVAVYDEKNTHALTATVEWFVARQE